MRPQDIRLDYPWRKDEQKTVSVELFPEDVSDPRIHKKIDSYVTFLNEYSLDFLSVTFGAGGSSWQKSIDFIAMLKQRVRIPIIAHITHLSFMKNSLANSIRRFYDLGIRNFLLIRGDPLPQDENAKDSRNKHSFQFTSDCLVYLKSLFSDCAFFVAGFPEGHPDTPNRGIEFDYLQKKIHAGASGIITQMCFMHHDVNDYIQRLRIKGLTTPVFLGLLPFRTRFRLDRIHRIALGARVPAALMEIVHSQNLQKSEKETLFTDYFFRELKQMRGYAGIHLYVLNNEICARKILPETIKIVTES